MDDLISRQAAIDAIEFGITYAKAVNKETGEIRELFKEGNDELIKAGERIKTLPSAQPKRGKWVRRLVDSGFNADWHCSECGWKTSLEEHGYNFCPACGADMRDTE